MGPKKYKTEKERLEARRTTQKKYRKNSAKYKEYQKKYAKEYSRSDKNKEYRKRYYQKNLDKIKEKQKTYRQQESYKEYQRNYNKTDRRKKYKKAWKKRSEKFKKWEKKYYVERRKRDPIFNLQHIVRTRLLTFLKVKNMKKKNKTFEMVGCTPKFLKKYLEKQFYPHPITNEKMNWKNHALKGWHIDHRNPLDYAKTLEDVEKLSHYTNLQPMWSKDNISKSNKKIRND